jgi:bifunctional UDP-N-acetylglucosamine pyrophosphorylase / glucosamine-1-phosphate N-acetyltransferase
MKSSTPKVLHKIAGKPLVLHALDTAREVSSSKPVLVIGYAGEAVRQAVGDQADYAVQEPQLGTGHAVMQAAGLLEGKSEHILVTYADMPLLTANTLKKMAEAHLASRAAVTMLSIQADNPRGFGRVIRDRDGKVQAIVEEAQASSEQLAVKELNSGVFCFKADWLWGALRRIPLSSKGEYYLTDLVEIARADQLVVEALKLEDSREAIGINNRIHLAEAEKILRERINQHWMLEGVTLIDPAATYIEARSGDRKGRYT